MESNTETPSSENNPTSAEQQPTPEITSQDSGHQNTEPEQPKRGNKKKLLFGISVLVVLVALSSALAYLHFYKTRAKTIPNVSATASTKKAESSKQSTAPAKPAPSYASALVFESANTTPKSETSIVGLDGTDVASYSSATTGSTYDPGDFSQSNLQMLGGSTFITSDKTFGSYSMVTSGGKSQPVAASLVPLLSANTRVNSPSALSESITIGTNQLIGLETPLNSLNSKLVKINLTTGNITDLLSINFAAPHTGYQPGELLATSRDGAIAYLLTNSAKLNSTTVPNTALVTVDLATGKFTTKQLPSSFPTTNIRDMAISNDGKLVAYTIYGASSGNYAKYVTHIYDVQTGKDTIVPTEGLVVSDGSFSMRFSPDNAYLSIVGNYGPDMHKAGMELQIISMSTKNVIHQIDSQNAQQIITGYGWAGDHTMIYSTNSSSTGIYAPTQAKYYSLDASTGKTFIFPQSGTAQLVDILNYQQSQ